MKKFLCLFVALVMGLSLCACSGNNGSQETNGDTNDTETQGESQIIYEIGDIASSDQCEIDVISFKFEDEWSHLGSYFRSDDDCFLVVEFTIRNIGKETYRESSVYPHVDYNDGYIFDVSDRIYNQSNIRSSITFFYNGAASITEVAPLSEKHVMKAAIAVPNEVRDNTSAPLIVYFSVPSTEGQTNLSFRVR